MGLVLLALSLTGAVMRRPPALLTGLLFVLPGIWALYGIAVLGRVRRPPRKHHRRLALAVLVFCGSVWGRAWLAWPDAPPGEGATSLTVMTWNVQRLGWNGPEATERRSCVVGTVQAADVDAVVFQEVTAADTRALAATLELQCAYADYRATGRSDVGGVAACARKSRWKLGEHGARQFSPEHDWHYVFTELVGGTRTVNLIGLHLQPYRLSAEPSLATAGRSIGHAQNAEAEALLDRVQRLRDPTIITGDFNSPRDAALHVSLRRHLRDAWETAAWGPGATVRAFGWLPLRIDYVYASEELAITDARRPVVGCADHEPVIASLWLSP